jgi:HNH endonuclease
MAILKQRFLADLDGTSEEVTTYVINEEGCYLWCGALTAGGYPELYDPEIDRVVYAHRVSCEHLDGPLPEKGRKFHVHHICGVKNCVNPEHLIVISARYHNAIIGRVNRVTRTHCNSGRHRWTDQNTRMLGKNKTCRLCYEAYHSSPHCKRIEQKNRSSEGYREKRNAVARRRMQQLKLDPMKWEAFKVKRRSYREKYRTARKGIAPVIPSDVGQRVGAM